MSWLLIWTLLVLCLWLIFRGLAQPGGIYAFPFLAAATFLGFALPQMPGLAADPFLPAGAFNKTALVTILCALGCTLGWTAGRRPFAAFNWAFDERRLLFVAAGLSAAGAVFFFKISHLPKEMTSASQWTGLPVAYLFLSTTLHYGFAIAAVSFARRPSKFALAIMLFDAMFYMDRIVIAGRRADTVEFFMIIALAFWFQRRVAVPRGLAVLGIILGGLAITSTGSYRSISNDGVTWSEVSNIDLWGNFKEQLDEGGPEMRNAVQRIYFVDKSLEFDYGVYHWNALVFNFIPAQIFGSAFKESLRIPDEGRQFSVDYASQIVGGSTDTGMADAFVSFWYLGAFKFFIIAYVMSRIYRAGVGGNTVLQIVYALSVTSGMHVITHETQHILSAWVQMSFMLIPFLTVARVQTSTTRSRWRREAPGVPAVARSPLEAGGLPAE